MKCFHLFNNERNVEPRTTTKSNSIISCTSKSMSMNQDLKMFDSDVNSQNVSEFSEASSAKSFAALSQRHSNLREFTFSDLKTATKNFSRSLMIGEGGFGSVYRGAIRNSEDSKRIDIAVKQLSRRGLQASSPTLPKFLLRYVLMCIIILGYSYLIIFIYVPIHPWTVEY